MRLIASDASVLIDLERGALLQVTFRLPHVFAVPRLAYRQEIEPFNGRELVQMGLCVVSLTSEGLELAQSYRARERRLSLSDAYALALAKLGGFGLLGSGTAFQTDGNHTLLSGDGALRTLAKAEDVECRGVLWILDEIERADLLAPGDLEAALSTIDANRRRRLPPAEVVARLIRYRQRRRS